YGGQAHHPARNRRARRPLGREVPRKAERPNPLKLSEVCGVGGRKSSPKIGSRGSLRIRPAAHLHVRIARPPDLGLDHERWEKPLRKSVGSRSTSRGPRGGCTRLTGCSERPILAL